MGKELTLETAVEAGTGVEEAGRNAGWALAAGGQALAVAAAPRPRALHSRTQCRHLLPGTEAGSVTVCPRRSRLRGKCRKRRYFRGLSPRFAQAPPT